MALEAVEDALWKLQHGRTVNFEGVIQDLESAASLDKKTRWTSSKLNSLFFVSNFSTFVQDIESVYGYHLNSDGLLALRVLEETKDWCVEAGHEVEIDRVVLDTLHNLVGGSLLVASEDVEFLARTSLGGRYPMATPFKTVVDLSVYHQVNPPMTPKEWGQKNHKATECLAHAGYKCSPQCVFPSHSLYVVFCPSLFIADWCHSELATRKMKCKETQVGHKIFMAASKII